MPAGSFLSDKHRSRNRKNCTIKMQALSIYEAFVCGLHSPLADADHCIVDVVTRQRQCSVHVE